MLVFVEIYEYLKSDKVADMLGLLLLKNIYWIWQMGSCLQHIIQSHHKSCHYSVHLNNLQALPYTTQIIEHVEGFCSTVRIKIKIYVQMSENESATLSIQVIQTKVGELVNAGGR